MGQDGHAGWVRRATPYGLAAGFVVAAVVVQLIVFPYVRPTPFLAIFGAVMASSRYGGLGPGLLATGVGGIVANVVFLPPAYALSLTLPDLVSMGLFGLISVLICYLSEDLRRSRVALERSNEELEARVEERTRDLRAAHRELEMFSYSVSHDLRAPVRAIDGFTHLLESSIGDEASPEVTGAISRIRASVRRMSTLIDDLLALARVGRGALSRHPVDVSRMAHEVLAELARDHPQHPVDVHVDDGIVIQADPALVRVVLVNLLGNAWKFTGRTAAPRIEVRAADGRPGTFVVRDNGAGFDPAYADRLFHPFERLHSQSEYEGNGVGLAIVKRVLDRHGGTVTVTATPGGGAAFVTEWPVPDQAPNPG